MNNVSGRIYESIFEIPIDGKIASPQKNKVEKLKKNNFE